MILRLAQWEDLRRNFWRYPLVNSEDFFGQNLYISLVSWDKKLSFYVKNIFHVTYLSYGLILYSEGKLRRKEGIPNKPFLTRSHVAGDSGERI